MKDELERRIRDVIYVECGICHEELMDNHSLEKFKEHWRKNHEVHYGRAYLIIKYGMVKINDILEIIKEVYGGEEMRKDWFVVLYEHKRRVPCQTVKIKEIFRVRDTRALVEWILKNKDESFVLYEGELVSDQS